MFYTFFTYTGQYPESRNSIIHIDYHLNFTNKERVIENIIHIIMDRFSSVLSASDKDKAFCSVMRDGDIIKTQYGNNNRTFQPVKVVSLINSDNIKLTAEQRYKKIEMRKSIEDFFSKHENKRLTLSSIVIPFYDYEHDETTTHKILKVEVEQDKSILVLSYNPIKQKYVVTKLTEWSYDMIYELHTKINMINRKL